MQRTRPFLVTILALLPAAPIVAGIAVVAQEGPGAAATPSLQTIDSSPPSALSGHGATKPPPGRLVAQVRTPTQLRATPGGRALGLLGLRTEFGSPHFLLVGRTLNGWLGVVSPLAGNGRLGWIPQSAATLSRDAYEIRIGLASHTLTVIEDHKVLARYGVADGAPSSPTPTGSFAVTDKLDTGNATGPYGCCILVTTAVSPHPIENWGGGNRIAVHSTPEVSSIGKSVSHGCVRVSLANGRWLLTHVPLGTPTVITS